MTSDFHDYNQIRNSDFVGCAFWIVVVLLAFAATRGCSTAEAAWPRTGPLTDTCDQIVDHWFYDEEGRLVFRQLVFMEHDGVRERVRDWRMVKSGGMLPVRQGDMWVSTWLDGEVFRRVRAGSFAELHTQYDIEMEDRHLHPEHLRKKLTLGTALHYKDGERVAPAFEWR
jgi:hypothetical protein